VTHGRSIGVKFIRWANNAVGSQQTALLSNSTFDFPLPTPTGPLRLLPYRLHLRSGNPFALACYWAVVYLGCLIVTSGVNDAAKGRKRKNAGRADFIAAKDSPSDRWQFRSLDNVKYGSTLWSLRNMSVGFKGKRIERCQRRTGIKTGVFEVNVVAWHRISSVNEERSGARDLAKKRGRNCHESYGLRPCRRRRTIAGF